MNVLDESNRIREKLRKARNVEEINLVADECRPTVKALIEHSEEGKTQARIIANLKEYRLRMMRAGQGATAGR